MRRNLVVGSALLAAAVASPVTNSSVNHTAVYDMNEVRPLAIVLAQAVLTDTDHSFHGLSLDAMLRELHLRAPHCSTRLYLCRRW